MTTENAQLPRGSDAPNPAVAGWACHTDSGPDHHVWPLHDLIEHVTEGDSECPCGPSTEPVERPDGSYGWLVTHHSLDGREAVR